MRILVFKNATVNKWIKQVFSVINDVEGDGSGIRPTEKKRRILF